MSVGELRETRLNCTEDEHYLTTYNPQMNLTFCWCGEVREPGLHPVWKSVARYDHAGKGAQVIGYDTYRLDVPW